MLEKGQFVSDWYTFGEINYDQITLGDILEFRRTADIVGGDKRLYTHWAIYIGRVADIPSVIHISTPDGDFDLTAGTGKVNSSLIPIVNASAVVAVRCDPIHLVAGTDQLRINNGLDRSRTPFSPSETVERAFKQLGTGNYNIVTNNCEHFCNYCRYDIRVSSQVQNGTALAVGMVVAATVNPVVGIGVGALYLLSSDHISEFLNNRLRRPP